MKPVQVDFEQHMREEAAQLNPFEVIIGEDFAVFEFDTDIALGVAQREVAQVVKRFDYKLYIGDGQRFAIVKGKVNDKL